MPGEAHGATTTMEKRKQNTAQFTMNPSQTISYPPETPPMFDPASMRCSRLTPNLRDMIHGLNQGVTDAHAMNDLLASPDPGAMYNSLQFGSPIFRDFYPSQSLVNTPHTPYDHHDAAERRERAAGTQAEMNALFNYQPSPNIELGAKTESIHEGGIMSMMSSPEVRKDASGDISGSGVSSSGENESSSDPRQRELDESESKNSLSQTSSQTPPPVDTSTSSPSPSPQILTKKAEREQSKLRKGSTTPKKPRKVISSEEKSKPSVKGNTKEKSPDALGSSGSAASASGGMSTGVATSGAQTSQPSQVHIHPAASAFAAANALAMNSAVAGMNPFACGMPPGMGGQMFPGAGTVHYQGRPMAIVPGARGAEMIPVELLAQASALHYGAAAQAMASRMMHPMGGAGAPHQERPTMSSFEPVGGSRKKRRRQMLERSGCSEEQARQNRAHALKRLRHKKSLRSQKNTVRYACRKRIAMVRPRVNGRFATKEEVEESEKVSPQLDS